MVKVICNRLYKGRIDIRSYTVSDAISENKSIEVTCKDVGVKIFTPEQLKTKIVAVSKDFKSKFKGTYKLISYEW